MSSRVIDLHAISKCYHLGESSVQALSHVDISVAVGEFVALSGPSGSGKSTLLNICGLLDSSDEGEYQLVGQDVAHLSKRESTLLRRELIGFIFQGFNLIPVMSAYENIEYPLLLSGIHARQRRQMVEDILERVGLEEFAKHRPDRLSGGQRQRVAAARALVKRPKLVIADEPTANLDSATATQLIELMKGLAHTNGSSFLVATHDERMSAHCDRKLQLMDGRIVS
jgi:putative ABC transport system ATP-binding protein